MHDEVLSIECTIYGTHDRQSLTSQSLRAQAPAHAGNEYITSAITSGCDGQCVCQEGRTNVSGEEMRLMS